MESGKVHLFDIPRELVMYTLMFCEVKDLFVFSCVCKYFQHIFKNTKWSQLIKPKKITQLIGILNIGNFVNYDITQLKIYDEKLLQKLSHIGEKILYNPNHTVDIVKHKPIHKFHMCAAIVLFDTYFEVTDDTLKIYLMNNYVDGYLTSHNTIWNTGNKTIIKFYIEYLKAYGKHCDAGYIYDFFYHSDIPPNLVYFAARTVAKLMHRKNPDLQEILSSLFLRETFDTEVLLEKINFYSKFLPVRTLEIHINPIVLQCIDQLITSHPTIKFVLDAKNENIDMLIKVSYLDMYVNNTNTKLNFLGSVSYANVIKLEQFCNPQSFIKNAVSNVWYHSCCNILVLPLIDIKTQPIETQLRWFQYANRDKTKLQYIYFMLGIESLTMQTRKEFLTGILVGILDQDTVIWCLEKNKDLLMNDKSLREDILHQIIQRSFTKVFEWWESIFTYDVLNLSTKKKIIIYDFAMLEVLLQSDMRGYQYEYHVDYYDDADPNLIIKSVLSSEKNLNECIDINSIFWHSKISTRFLEILFEMGYFESLTLPEDIPEISPVTIMWLHKKNFFTRSIDPNTAELEDFFRWKGKQTIKIEWWRTFIEMFYHGSLDECIGAIKKLQSIGINFCVDEWPNALSSPKISLCSVSNFDKIYDFLVTLPECSQRNYFIVSLAFSCKSQEECAKFLFQHHEWINYFIFDHHIRSVTSYVKFLEHCQKISSERECNVDILIDSLLYHLFETMFDSAEMGRARQMGIIKIIKKLDYYHKVELLVKDFKYQRRWWISTKQFFK